jgi:DNA-binding XRE family transcriptional regulator
MKAIKNALFFLILHKNVSFPRYFQYLCSRKTYINMENKKDLNRIKVMLAEKKKTNKWLASAVGVNAATVSKWCTNSSQPSLETLMKIAELLEVNYTELIRVEPKS